MKFEEAVDRLQKQFDSLNRLLEDVSEDDEAVLRRIDDLLVKMTIASPNLKNWTIKRW